METLPSLTLRPPLGFRSGLVPRTTYSPFGVSSSLGVRGVALCNIPCLIVELYFLNMAWLDIKSIVKLIKFSFHVALQVLLFFLWPPFHLQMAWAWILVLDPLIAFHLSLLWPSLYSCVPFIFWQKVQLTFCLPLDHLTCDLLIDVATYHLFLLFLQCCLSSPPCGDITRHKEIKVCL
jgi:hypothetical protein